MKTINTQTFIQNAVGKHGNKYDYTPTIWLNSRDKVEIICPRHGKFLQTPNNHLSGYGCKECGYEENRAKQVQLVQQFIEKAENIHGKTYDYSSVEYINTATKVCITCPEHGDFYMTPSNHTHKTNPQGCPVCATIKRAGGRRLPFGVVIQRATEVHCGKYTYDLKQHPKYHDKMTITCPTHGNFEQTVAHHLNGTGCPTCAQYGFNPLKPAYLYYLKINDGQFYKIGITNRTVEERFNLTDLQKIEVQHKWYFSKGADAKSIEQRILADYTDYKYSGSPILRDGNTEVFTEDIYEMSKVLKGLL